MSKRFYLTHRQIARDQQIIIGVASMCEHTGCAQRTFTPEERYVFTQAWFAICKNQNLNFEAKRDRVNALMLEFL